MSKVRLEGVGKSYGEGSAVLRDVSIDVAAGEFLALLGPSGCGKSTLLRIIAGLEPQDTGVVHVGDQCVDGLSPRERNIAMVFQSHALYPHLTVRENLALPLRMRRLAAYQRIPLLHWLMPGTRAVRRQIDLDVQAAAAVCKVEHLLERQPEQLSGV